MRRGQRIKILHPPHYIFVELDHPGNSARVYGLKSHRVQLLHRRQHPALGQAREGLVNRTGVVGQIHGLRDLVGPADLEGVYRALAPNPIHATARQNHFFGHGKDLVLKRGTAEIGN